jgi:hypothetical protein
MVKPTSSATIDPSKMTAPQATTQAPVPARAATRMRTSKTTKTTSTLSLRTTAAPTKSSLQAVASQITRSPALSTATHCSHCSHYLRGSPSFTRRAPASSSSPSSLAPSSIGLALSLHSGSSWPVRLTQSLCSTPTRRQQWLCIWKLELAQ